MIPAAEDSSASRPVRPLPADCAKSRTRRAVIDIGTNAVKMLIGEVTGSEVTPVLEVNEQTRLGKGFYPSHVLRGEAIAATAQAVEKFALQARSEGVENVRVIATSAAREAINARALVDAIFQAAGTPVEIISGDTEARLAFQGVVQCGNFGAGPMLIMDLGGGSTEFILGRGQECLCRQSFPLGAVRLLEAFPQADPPDPSAREICIARAVDMIRRVVRPALEPFASQTPPKFLIGIGGSAAILARINLRLASFDRSRIEAARLSRNQVSSHCAELWGVSLTERKKTVGLPPDRADIIIMGVAIYEAAMEVFNLDELRVSSRGLRFAALLEGN
jgi:exopolyphosphatase/guanosine-5'-triphosphate,3'-diphosphate pyrophosphatase